MYIDKINFLLPNQFKIQNLMKPLDGVWSLEYLQMQTQTLDRILRSSAESLNIWPGVSDMLLDIWNSATVSQGVK